jgi:site-specific recombinase XerD
VVVTTAKQSALASPAVLLQVREQLPLQFRLDPIPIDPEGRYSKPACRVSSCSRISAAPNGLCRTHAGVLGESLLDIDAWLDTEPGTRVRGDGLSTFGNFDVAAVGSDQLRDELAYGLFRRGAEGHRTHPAVVNRLVKSLAPLKLISLLDLRYDKDSIDAVAHRCGGHSGTARAFLLDTLDVLCELIGVEPTRRSLGIASAGGRAFISLSALRNDEFRASLTRWVDYRTATENGSPQYIQASVGHIMEFCEYLDNQGISRWSDLRRSHLVGYLPVLAAQKSRTGVTYSRKYRSAKISALSIFIDEATANGWADIPGDVRWLRNERPSPEKTPPRLIGKLAARRLRSPEVLALVEDPDLAMAIRIMAETGLRRKDVVAGMTVDCLLSLGEDKWSLRYFNSKAKAWKTAPIRVELAQAITDHIEYKQQRFPGNNNLFANNAEDRVLTLTLVNRALHNLIRRADLRDANGKYLKVTPHMFRHQNATDWLDAGIPITAIKELLGHESLVTTEIYARMNTEKVREQWEKSFAINAAGEVVQSPGSEVKEAAWLHAFTGGAAQALPNGRCGMPCGETCEHANACLYCPLFITTPDYLPVLREQRDDHARMIEMAKEQGYQRIVDKNSKPFIALTKLIEQLEGHGDRKSSPHRRGSL